MKRKLSCFVIITIFIMLLVFPTFLSFAKENNSESKVADGPSIIYKLGDSRIPSVDMDNTLYDLSAEKEAPLGSVIIYKQDDKKFPFIDMDNVNILDEIFVRGDFKPTDFCDLSYQNYSYSFSNVKNYVYTEKYFNTNSRGYISITTNEINGPIRISMIEYGSDTIVSKWEGDPKEISGLGFKTDRTKTYYFMFEPLDNNIISGAGVIFHNN